MVLMACGKRVKMISLVGMRIVATCVATRMRGTQEEFDSLAADISERGILRKPVIVVTETGIVCLHGHRRIEAAKANSIKEHGRPDCMIDVILVMGDLTRLPESLNH